MKWLDKLSAVLDAPILQPIIWGGWLYGVFILVRLVYKGATCE